MADSEVNYPFAGDSLIEEFELLFRAGVSGWDIKIQLLPLKEKLNQPFFKSGDVREIIPGLTYRQINHWEKKDLLSPYRKTNDTGWRMFSVAEVVWLSLIQRFRTQGLGIASIKKIMNKLIDKNPDPTPRLSLFELCIVWSANSDIGIVATQPEGMIVTEVGVSEFEVGIPVKPRGSFTYVNLSSIVVPVLRSAGAEIDGPTMSDPQELDSVSRELLSIIWSNENERITITKIKDRQLDVRTLTRRQGKWDPVTAVRELGSGDDSKLELHRKDGKIVTIVTEQRRRLKK